MARESLWAGLSPGPSLALPLSRDPCQGSRPGRCQHAVQTLHFPHSFFNWIFGPAGQNKLSTGRALLHPLNARWCPAAPGRMSPSFWAKAVIPSPQGHKTLAHIDTPHHTQPTHLLPRPGNSASLGELYFETFLENSYSHIPGEEAAWNGQTLACGRSRGLLRHQTPARVGLLSD